MCRRTWSGGRRVSYRNRLESGTSSAVPPSVMLMSVFVSVTPSAER